MRGLAEARPFRRSNFVNRVDQQTAQNVLRDKKRTDDCSYSKHTRRILICLLVRVAGLVVTDSRDVNVFEAT